MANSAIGNLGNLGDQQRDKSSVSPSTRLKDRRIFGSEAPGSKGGTDGLFRHRDLFQKA